MFHLLHPSEAHCGGGEHQRNQAQKGQQMDEENEVLGGDSGLCSVILVLGKCLDLSGSSRHISPYPHQIVPPQTSEVHLQRETLLVPNTPVQVVHCLEKAIGGHYSQTQVAENFPVLFPGQTSRSELHCNQQHTELCLRC